MSNEKPHCLSDYWQIEHNRRLSAKNTKMPNRMNDSSAQHYIKKGKVPHKRYGKTCGKYNPKYRRVKKGNKAIFQYGEVVSVNNRQGYIRDHYEYDGVIFYQIAWRVGDSQLSWYDRHIGNDKVPSRGWTEARFIKRIDE